MIPSQIALKTSGIDKHLFLPRNARATPAKTALLVDCRAAAFCLT